MPQPALPLAPHVLSLSASTLAKLADSQEMPPLNTVYNDVLSAARLELGDRGVHVASLVLEAVQAALNAGGLADRQPPYRCGMGVLDEALEQGRIGVLGFCDDGDGSVRVDLIALVSDRWEECPRMSFRVIGDGTHMTDDVAWFSGAVIYHEDDLALLLHRHYAEVVENVQIWKRRPHS